MFYLCTACMLSLLASYISHFFTSFTNNLFTSCLKTSFILKHTPFISFPMMTLQRSARDQLIRASAACSSFQCWPSMAGSPIVPLRMLRRLMTDHGCESYTVAVWAKRAPTNSHSTHAHMMQSAFFAVMLYVWKPLSGTVKGAALKECRVHCLHRPRFIRWSFF